MYDCIIAGGGVIGTAILDALAQKGLKTLLLEKDDDVATGASRANSGIVHAGYDAVTGTLKARFNVEGCKLFPELTADLDVPFLKTGSLVVATADGFDELKKLEARGKANGAKVQIIGENEIRKIEPNISDDIKYALYAPEAGVVSPYKLTIAFADRAILNGAEVKTQSEVIEIGFKDGVYTVKTADCAYQSKYFINAAGAGAARINDQAGAEHYDTAYARGDYFVLDQTERTKINTVVFPLPDEKGKGILVAPTADGNVIYGPTSIPCSADDTAVSADGLAIIRQNVGKMYKAPNFRKVIRVYAGVRAICGQDFIIEKSKKLPNYIYLIGICSPGLTSAPSIAEYVSGLVDLPAKPLNKAVTKLYHKRLARLSNSEINELVKADPRWGRIICRCEKVTEAEIVDAIHSPLPATTVDAVKRRVRAGMGRCQGGFCMPRVIEILSRELNIPMTEVKKGGVGSNIALARVKENL